MMPILFKRPLSIRYRAMRQCLEASAVILGNKLMAPVMISQLPVRRWDQDLIVVDGGGARCVDEVYAFHVSSKSCNRIDDEKAR